MIWIDILLKAVLKTSNEIKKYYGNSKSLNVIGAGGDIVEEIDKKAEDAIISYLKDSKKSFNLISEEVGELRVGKSSSDYIVMDPIDGSTNAPRGIQPTQCPQELSMSISNRSKHLRKPPSEFHA